MLPLSTRFCLRSINDVTVHVGTRLHFSDSRMLSGNFDRARGAVSGVMAELPRREVVMAAKGKNLRTQSAEGALDAED